MTTEQAILRAILADPADDQLRLAFADLLEETGSDPARAEFIRVQMALCSCTYSNHNRSRTCDRCLREQQLLSDPHNFCNWVPLAWHQGSQAWVRYGTGTEIQCGNSTTEIERVTFARGFPAAITLPTAAYVGGPCDGCRGRGVRIIERSDPRDPVPNMLGCHVCHGTGRTEGHAATIFRVAPITSVTLSDMHPGTTDREPGFRDYYCWPTTHHLMSRLGGVADHLKFGHDSWRDTEAECMADLSAACVAHGRKEAGL